MQVIVHTDGGSRGNPGPAGIGVLIEIDGQTPVELAEYIGTATNNVAEHTAVLRAIEKLITLPLAPTQVHFYLDSLLVVEQLNRRYAIKKAELRAIASQVWEKIQPLPYPVRFSHVPRAQNAEADRLVNFALDRELNRR